VCVFVVVVILAQVILENYAFTDIVTWGHSDEKFILVVGNLVQQRKLIFHAAHVSVSLLLFTHSLFCHALTGCFFLFFYVLLIYVINNSYLCN